MRTRWIRSVTISFLVVVSSGLGATLSSASFPGGNGLIAFSYLEHGGTEVAGIAVIQPDGNGFELLTDPAGYKQDSAPAWSADGATIAFVRVGKRWLRSDLWIIGADGNDLTRLTRTRRPESCPAWSPDASQVLFTRTNLASYDSDLWVIDVATGTETRLTETPRVDESCGDWSPDGTTLVFSRYAFASNRSDIATMQPDGSDRQVLIETFPNESNPSWSPDGSRILFEAAPPKLIDHTWIATMAADGSDRTIVLSHPDRDYYGPEYSPDGAEVTFWWEPRSGTAIFVVGIDGTGMARVTAKDLQTENLTPAWQPIVP